MKIFCQKKGTAIENKVLTPKMKENKVKHDKEKVSEVNLIHQPFHKIDLWQ